MKVSELSGGLLALWVAKAEGKVIRVITTNHYPFNDKETEIFARYDAKLNYYETPSIGIRRDATDYAPHEDWAQGGPIIERERVSITPPQAVGDYDEWRAFAYGDLDGEWGKAPLIAAMRAYVASKYGDEVPDDPS